MATDNIINFLLHGFGSTNKEDNAKFYINKNFVRNNGSAVLKIILPPWGDGDSLVTKILIRRLQNRGYSTLNYFFPRNILSPDVKATIESFYFIRDQIKSDIAKLKAEQGFKQIDINAPSLGVVSACLIANNNNDVNNLFFIVPGSGLAASLWNGIRTQKLKNNYQRQNISEEQLIKIWTSLAPKENINALIGRNIFVAISRADKIIPYRFGKELADSLQKLYPNNTAVKQNSHLGHYLTVIKYYMFGRELLK
jgi:hypothetical protein